jgi:short subunit dehydrogenase-like uncharacterized protein
VGGTAASDPGFRYAPSGLLVRSWGPVMWMIYGANGYTGELAAREAARRGLRPVLAGRNAEAVASLAMELGLSSRAFGLDDPSALRAGLDGMTAVLHCAGPFVRTSTPMVAACLAGKVHYLDITGEIAVFEAILARSRAAERAGVALLGAGFDVVPSDCLAARLAEALPSAVELVLAFASDRGGWSRGTLKTVIESLPALGAVRRGGRIVPVPAAYDSRKIDFGLGLGERWAMTIPWGDVSTAFHSTGIPDIRVYTAAPPAAIRRLRLLSHLAPLAALGPVKRRLQRRVERTVTGPSAEIRATARTYLWGQAKDAAGRIATARIETPEAYAFTAVSAVEAASRADAGSIALGAWTPSRAFGARFVDSLPGVLASPVELSPS